MHVSLGPRNIGDVSGNPDEDYGHIWILTQRPQDNYLVLSVVRRANGSPLPWVRDRRYFSSSEQVSTSSLYSVLIPDAQMIVRATFAFDVYGYPVLAVDKFLGSGGRVVEVYDWRPNQIVSLPGASGALLVPEYFVNRRFSEGEVYMVYIGEGNATVSYMAFSRRGPEERYSNRGGVLTQIPISFRSGATFYSYAYRPYGLEIVLTDVSGGSYYVELRSDDVVAEDYALLSVLNSLSRTRRAIRVRDELSVSPSHRASKIKEVFRSALQDRTSTHPTSGCSVGQEVGRFTTSDSSSLLPTLGQSVFRAAYGGRVQDRMSCGYSIAGSRIRSVVGESARDDVSSVTSQSVILHALGFGDLVVDGFVPSARVGVGTFPSLYPVSLEDRMHQEVGVAVRMVQVQAPRVSQGQAPLVLIYS